MKRTVRVVGCLFAMMVCAACGWAGAGELAIQSFDSQQMRITFTTIPAASINLVEFAPSPTGQWESAQAGLAPANSITIDSQTAASGFYRVIAAVTNRSVPAPSANMVLIPSGHFQMGSP